MLLDTCALLWLAEGGDRLTPLARAAIAAAPAVYVSAVTGFEIGLKAARRKLDLPVPAREWFAAIVEHHGLSVVSLDLEACIAATELPPIHADPCDRFLIATARAREWPVVSADPVFRQYDVQVVW
jgi:PIN domain nuclease of toxin-antitoxin system